MTTRREVFNETGRHRKPCYQLPFRFSDAFLIVTPGITIKDRLRVLLPNDPQNYYRQRDVLPAELMDDLGKAKIIITNFHAFRLRERNEAGRLTKKILAQGGRRRVQKRQGSQSFHRPHIVGAGSQ